MLTWMHWLVNARVLIISTIIQCPDCDDEVKILKHIRLCNVSVLKTMIQNTTFYAYFAKYKHIKSQ